MRVPFAERVIPCLLPVLSLTTLLLTMPAGSASGNEFYISQSGNDTWSGKLPEPNADGTDGPFDTFERAMEAVRALVTGGLAAPVAVSIREGTYYLPEGITFGPEDAGTPEYAVVWKAFPGESPALIGGTTVDGWEHDPERDIWTALIPDGVSPGQLFENGRRLRLARTPNAGYLGIEGPVKGREHEAFYYDPADLDPRGWDISSGSVFIWPGHNWFSYVKPITEIDTKNNALTMGTAHGYEMRSGDRYFIQNIPELLDLPGECVIDGKKKMILCKPYETPIEPGRMVISTADSVVRIAGSGPGGMVRNLHLEGLTIKIANGDAVVLANAELCSVLNCDIEGAGNRGVVLAGDARACEVTGNRVAFHGGHGIELSGSALGERLKNYGNIVTNNHVEYCGRLQGHGYGIAIQGCAENRIEHNHIHHMPRYGITIKGTCFTGNARMIDGATFEARVAKALIHSRNNRIAYNLIHHVNLDSQDTGAIEAWGPGIGNEIINNVIHDVGNRHFDLISGIYLDDAAGYFTVTDNIIWGIHGTHGNQCVYTKGIGNIIQNNVFVCSPEGVRGIRSFEMANELARAHHYNQNVFLFKDDERILYRFDNWSDDRLASSDYNLFAPGDEFPRTSGAPGDGSWKDWRSLLGGKFDAHSVAADPLFVDPGNHDYRLRPDSPAPDLGIHSIDTSSVGLTEYLFDDDPALTSSLTMLGEPSSGPEPVAGRVRLSIENVGTVPSRGTVKLAIHPPTAGSITGTDEIEYDLKGGQQSRFEMRIRPEAGARKLLLMALPSDRWLDPVYLPVRRRAEVRIPRLGLSGTSDSVLDSLGELDAFPASYPPHRLGDIRFALAGTNLAIRAEVNDSDVRHATNPWEASCIEVFASPVDANRISQVFLQPGSDELPTEVRRGLADGVPLIQDASATTTILDGGYVLEALIPLSVLGLPRETREFLFEAAVIARPGGKEKYERAMLFGGPSAFNETSGYARIRVVEP